MDHGDLELVSTTDLIDELMRRSTFQGIVVHSEHEAKRPHWEGERIFKVHYNANFEPEQVSRLLGVVSEYMERSDA